MWMCYIYLLLMLKFQTRYCDLKLMIQQNCNLKEIILDNLMSDGKGNKKVTVGLAEEGDAAILVRKINGLFVGEHQLYVENVKQNKVSECFLLHIYIQVECMKQACVLSIWHHFTYFEVISKYVK